MCVVSTTMPPTVFLAGIAAPILIFARRSSQHPVAGSGTGDHRHFSMYSGVGLGLVRHAVAASTERAYLGHFGAWVDFRVRFGVPVFLDRGIDDMTNVWHLFEYVAYALATKKLRSATIESHLSAIKFFHRISGGFELDTTHPVIASALKGAARRMQKWVMRRPCFGQCRGLCCLLAKL